MMRSMTFAVAARPIRLFFHMMFWGCLRGTFAPPARPERLVGNLPFAPAISATDPRLIARCRRSSCRGCKSQSRCSTHMENQMKRYVSAVALFTSLANAGSDRLHGAGLGGLSCG